MEWGGLGLVLDDAVSAPGRAGTVERGWAGLVGFQRGMSDTVAAPSELWASQRMRLRKGVVMAEWEE